MTADKKGQRDVADPGLTGDLHVERYTAADAAVDKGKALRKRAPAIRTGVVGRGDKTR